EGRDLAEAETAPPQGEEDALRRGRSQRRAGGHSCPPSSSAAFLRQYSRLLRVVRVWGWSRPRTRVRSGRSSANRRAASAGFPAWPVQAARMGRADGGTAVTGKRSLQASAWRKGS